MRLIPLGDSAVTIELESPARAVAVARELLRYDLPEVVDAVTAFSSVTVFYELRQSYQQLCGTILDIASHACDEPQSSTGRLIEIPVRYGGEVGIDLEAVSESSGLSTEEIIHLHSSTEYTVLAIGFLPGFAYLGGLPEILHTPRRATPRTKVPAGAVGIGGPYTGVYPFASPGGWNIIGQTSLCMFDPTRESPSLLRVGDRVRFVPAE